MRPWIAALVLLFATFAMPAEQDPTDVIAIVLGEEITVADLAEVGIDSLIGGRLIDKFAADNGIAATEEEMAALTNRLDDAQRKLLAEFEAERAELAEAVRNAAEPEEREELRGRLEGVQMRMEAMSLGEIDTDIEWDMAKRWVESWKQLKALFDRYGGRAHYQQVGVQPFDAVKEFLEEQQADGAFTILDPVYEDEFWAYWRSDGHRFIPEDEAAEMLAVPWWMMAEPTDE